MLDAQGEILEGMARGVPLRETAEGIALLVEKLLPMARCAITLVKHDGKHLMPLAAPNLCHYYFTALDGIEIAHDCGSTGTAAWRRQPVIVTDTATDPLWRNLRDFAENAGIRSCVAMPILNDDTVLGVLTLYYEDAHKPQEWDFSALSSCIKLIRMALAADRREQELRASDIRWQIGVEAAGVGTFDVNFETGINVWSPAMRVILGIGEDTPATFETFVHLVHPDDRGRFALRLPNAPLRRSSGPWNEEIRICRANDGAVRHITTKGRFLTDATGRPLHAVGTIYDITTLRQHEADLEKAKQQAEDANRAKSRFLASMSHELRTPLNAIIGFSDMMRSGVFGPISPPRYADYVDDIHKSGTHLLNLINDVLDMAKIEAQKFELRRSPIPLERLAEQALMLVRPQALAKGLSLNSDLADGSLHLDADERILCQVLVNLLSNAVKFTAEGGAVRLFATPSGDGLDLGVEDNGAGMSPAGITTALEPFGQIEMDVAVERNGTGLGLPLAKAMLEAHGAVFHIESQLGTGTRIWGTFPAASLTAPVRKAG